MKRETNQSTLLTLGHMDAYFIKRNSRNVRMSDSYKRSELEKSYTYRLIRNYNGLHRKQ